MGGDKSLSQNLTCPEEQIRVFNEGRLTKVVGQSAKALEQFAMKRTCGSHLPLRDRKMREENSSGIKQAKRQ